MVWDRLSLTWFFRGYHCGMISDWKVSLLTTRYFLNTLRCQNQVNISLLTNKTRILREGPCSAYNKCISQCFPKILS